LASVFVRFAEPQTYRPLIRPLYRMRPLGRVSMVPSWSIRRLRFSASSWESSIPAELSLLLEVDLVVVDFGIRQFVEPRDQASKRDDVATPLRLGHQPTRAAVLPER